MYSVKDERVMDPSSFHTISNFGDDSKAPEAPEVDTTHLSSIGMKGMDGNGRYFSIDFTDATIRNGDHCKINKTSEMKADEFWDELTAYSKIELSKLINQAKMLGAENIKSKIDAMNLMFKKPDIVLGSDTIHQAAFLDVIRKYGEIQKPSYLSDLTTSLSVLTMRDNLISSGRVGTGCVQLWDHNIGKDLTTYSLTSGRSTANLISQQDNLMAVLDDTALITIFDIRQANSIHKISSLKGSCQLPVTLQMEYNQLLLGTSEGPIMLPVNCESGECLRLPEGPSHKAQFLSQGLVATVQIGSEDLTLINTSTGQTSQMNIPGEEIIDFCVNQNKDTIAVVSSRKGTSKYYLRLIKKSTQGYDWTQYLKIPRMPYRVMFPKSDQVLVVDEKYFDMYSTSNKPFVSALKQKLTKYIA